MEIVAMGTFYLDALAGWPHIQRMATTTDPTATETETLTSEMITALRTEAGSAGDYEMVTLCDAADEGDDEGLEACARAITDQRAMRLAARANYEPFVAEPVITVVASDDVRQWCVVPAPGYATSMSRQRLGKRHATLSAARKAQKRVGAQRAVVEVRESYSDTVQMMDFVGWYVWPDA